jgi:hypothetical protein
MEKGKKIRRTVKKEKYTREVKIIQETLEQDSKTNLFFIEQLTKIDEEIYAKEGIHLIDAIKEKCPNIALKLVEILMSLSNK